MRQYRIKNAARIKELQDKYRATHPEYRDKAARRAREWGAENKERRRLVARQTREQKIKEDEDLFFYLRRRSRLKHLYGITPEQYDEMFDAQKGVCAICEAPPNKKRLNIDHDHKTGKVRGLLCAPCNRWIGRMGDDPERILQAVAYLEAAR